jgi:hypothetical protein
MSIFIAVRLADVRSTLLKLRCSSLLQFPLAIVHGSSYSYYALAVILRVSGHRTRRYRNEYEHPSIEIEHEYEYERSQDGAT